MKKTTRAERKANRPQEILDAAFEEFASKGYMATRVEDVAARLNVTKGTVYLYFPTKDLLFEEVMRHVSTPFVEMRAAIAALTGTHAERLRAMLTLAYEQVVNDRRMREPLRLSLAEGSRFPHIVDQHYDQFIAPLISMVGTLVREGVETGEFRDAPASQTPEVIVSSIIHIAIWRLMFEDRRPLDERAFMAAHIDMVLKGLINRA